MRAYGALAIWRFWWLQECSEVCVQRGEATLLAMRQTLIRTPKARLRRADS